MGIRNFGVLPAAAIGFAPANPRDLPWATVLHPTSGAVVAVFSIHGPPVFGATTVAGVCAWDNAQIGQINVLAGGGGWVCLGDFNVDPTGLAPPYVAPPAGNVVRGNHATQQGGGLLDYAVTTVGTLAYVAQGQLAGASDHYPQTFSC